MIRISEKGVEWTDDGSCRFEGNKVVGGPKECCKTHSGLMRALKAIRKSGHRYHVKVANKQYPDDTFLLEIGDVNPLVQEIVCPCGKRHA